MTIQYCLKPFRGQPSYRDIEYILQHTLKKKRHELYLSLDQSLSPAQRKKTQKYINLYQQGRPLAYILGQVEFFGLMFSIDEEVFIPRLDTEILVETALKHLSSFKNQPFYLMDFGCGSGCIGLSLLYHLPKAHLLAVDLNQKALDLTQKNALSLGLWDRVSLIRSDIDGLRLEDFPSLSFITANPPYIAPNDPHIEKSVLQFEPHTALFSKNKGLSDIQKWLNKACCLLNHNKSSLANQKKKMTFQYISSSRAKKHLPLEKKEYSSLFIKGKDSGHVFNYFFEIGYDQKYLVKNILKKTPVGSVFSFCL